MNTFIENMNTDIKFIHKCPYQDLIEIKNFDYKDEGFFSIYPSGHYKTTVKICYNQNDHCLTVSFDELVRSPFDLG